MYSLNNPTVIAPGIVVYDDIIKNTQRFIDLSLKTDGWVDPEIYDTDTNNNMVSIINHDIRNSKNLPFYHDYSDPIEWFELYQVIWRYADAYSKFYNTLFKSMEFCQFIHYKKYDGYYHSHYDATPGSNRVFSCVLYLNDVSEGGETYFNNFDIAVKPVAGRILFFPSEYSYTHEARMPKNGDKFVIVTWFRNQEK